MSLRFLQLRFFKIRTRLSFAIVAILLASGQATAQSAEYEQAFNAYQNQQFDSAESLWGSLAKEGDINAQYALGVMHLRQEASDSSPVAAFSWFEKAASQGHATAMFNLGVAYWEGAGVAQDKSKALELWQEAALKGDSGAQFNLGLAYYIGEERTADLDQASKWIGLAADQNHPEAKRILKVIDNEKKNKSELIVANTASSSDTNSTETASSSTASVSNSTVTKAKTNQYWKSIDAKTSLFNEPSGIPFRDLAPNTPLEVSGQDGGWAKVTLPDGLKTWIYSRFIEVDGNTGTIIGADVRVRPSPSTDNNTSPPLGKYREGEEVEVLGTEGDWTQIRAPKKIGGWLRTEEIQEYSDTSENRKKQWEQAKASGA
ncbi:MAG: SEL1-like repeat protein [Acidiferrobacterales bacterium]|nr:SEL1-like repeat protein [Acidiferrobacterales bacterium]